jgi:hypothetical protein
VIENGREVGALHSNEFEKAFADLIDRREYDEVQNALFSMVRMSFTAGWQAAGGDPPSPHKIFEVLPRTEQEDEK